MPSQPFTCSCRSPAKASGGPLCRDLAETEHIDVVRHPHDPANIVVDQQDRHLLGREKIDPADRPPRRSWVRIRCSARRSGTDVAAPDRPWRIRPSSAGRRTDRRPWRRGVSRSIGNFAYISSKRIGDVRRARPRSPREMIERQPQIVLHAHEREQARFLRDVADAAVDRGMRRDPGDIGAVELDTRRRSDAGSRRSSS